MAVLGELTAADGHDGAGDGADDGRVISEGRLLVGLGEVVVAEHDRGRVAEGGGDRGVAAADRGVVDHVVVDEGRGVGQLNRGGGVEVGIAQLTEAAGQEDQSRPQTLAAGAEELAHRARQRLTVGRDRLPDPGLEAVEVLRHRPEDAGHYRSSQRSTSVTSGTSCPKRMVATSLNRLGTAVTISS